MRTLRTSLLVATAAVTLSGCIGLGGKTPPFLLTLDADAAPAAGAARTASDAATLTILIPTAPQKLRTPRIPVQQDDASVAYVKDATWVERPARQFRRLLAETIRAKGGRLVVEGEDAEVGGKVKLSGRLLDMGYDARSQAVVVRFDAVREDGTGAATTKRFEATVPGVAADGKVIGPALNKAANDVAAQVADWMG